MLEQILDELSLAEVPSEFLARFQLQPWLCLCMNRVLGQVLVLLGDWQGVAVDREETVGRDKPNDGHSGAGHDH